MAAAPADAAFRIALPRARPHSLTVWAQLGPSVPAPDQLAKATCAWLDRYVQPPYRTSLRTFVEQGGVRFAVELAGTRPAPPLPALRAAGLGGEEERRLKIATHEIVLEAQDTPGQPSLALPAILAAGRALSQAYTGAVMDRESPRVPPAYLDREPMQPGLRLREVASLVTSYRDGSQVIRSHGLRFLGLPELMIEGVPPGLGTAVEAALEAIAQILVARARKAWSSAGDLVVAPEMLLRLDHPALIKAGYAPPAFPNAQREALIRLEWVRPQGGEDTRPSWRLCQPHGVQPPGGITSRIWWIEKLAEDLFGHREAPRKAAVDVEAGRLKAVAELPELKARYERGLPAGAQLYVRKAFVTKDGNPELMWVSVSSWSREGLRGQLANVPKRRTDLSIGQRLLVAEADVFDWMVRLQDGTEVGAFTLAPEERWKVR